MNAKKLVLVALCAMLVSCAKEVTVSNSESSVQELNAMSSENSFAKILSKAVSENENLRVFIKNQALRQFDKDFYCCPLKVSEQRDIHPQCCCNGIADDFSEGKPLS